MIRPEHTLMIGNTPYYSYDNASVGAISNKHLCIEKNGLTTYVPMEMNTVASGVNITRPGYEFHLVSVPPSIVLSGSYYRGTVYDYMNNVTIDSHMRYNGSISRPIEVYGERVTSYGRDHLFTMPADGIKTDQFSYHFGSSIVEDPPELFVKVGTDVIWNSGWLPNPGSGGTWYFEYTIPIPREWW